MNDSVSEDPLQSSARQRPSKHTVTDASSTKANVPTVIRWKVDSSLWRSILRCFCTVLVCVYVVFDVMGKWWWKIETEYVWQAFQKKTVISKCWWCLNVRPSDCSFCVDIVLGHLCDFFCSKFVIVSPSNGKMWWESCCIVKLSTSNHYKCR